MVVQLEALLQYLTARSWVQTLVWCFSARRWHVFSGYTGILQKYSSRRQTSGTKSDKTKKSAKGRTHFTALCTPNAYILQLCEITNNRYISLQIFDMIFVIVPYIFQYGQYLLSEVDQPIISKVCQLYLTITNKLLPFRNINIQFVKCSFSLSFVWNYTLGWCLPLIKHFLISIYYYYY